MACGNLPQSSQQHPTYRSAHDFDDRAVLAIQSKKDLAAMCEVTDIDTGAFQRCTFTYFDDRDFTWFGQVSGIRKQCLTINDIRANLKRIPDEMIYPIATPLITVFMDGDLAKFFVKRPQALCLDDEEEAKLLPRILIEEAEILQLILRNPHPNIIRYYGCSVKRGRVTGIVLERHNVILQHRYEDDKRAFDIDSCIKGIRAGVRHLHSLGLAHNDLNPSNIALDAGDRPIILDFGSCKRFGEQLLSAGTPGWIDESYHTSAAEHDEIAIDKLEAWLISMESMGDKDAIPQRS